MVILGVATPFVHDPSAAILVNGKVVAACDEERLIRKKHAMGYLPIKAVKFCLKKAGLKPSDIDAVAFPWSHDIYREKKSEYFWRCLGPRTSYAVKALMREKARLRGKEEKLDAILDKCGIPKERVKIYFIEHHLAHASSAYHLSGMKDCAIMSIDGAGEFTSTLFAKSENGSVKKIREIILPDSLGFFYATITEYLGFETNDGEYKVMGMAPYGDPSKVDMNRVIRYTDKSFRCNDDYVW
ncbi:MAG: carbamoyltransferase, partial [Candidatus Omnitrophica bacterium]|nr:carbamoyltransferase [Candidatus Omnitrophota bacterium]